MEKSSFLLEENKNSNMEDDQHTTYFAYIVLYHAV